MMKRQPESLIYETGAKYDLKMKLLVTIVLAATLVPGFILLATGDYADGWIMLGVSAFDALLFHAVLPRRYHLFTDKLRIVLGRPFAINIRYSTITDVHAGTTSQAFIYWGIRFATSSDNIIEIVRGRGLSMVISPENKTVFLEQLRQLLATAGSR